jgi:hypothetical protein
VIIKIVMQEEKYKGKKAIQTLTQEEENISVRVEG